MELASLMDYILYDIYLYSTACIGNTRYTCISDGVLPE